ncbi:unnamed protein product, partial [marine sediment metagenome]
YRKIIENAKKLANQLGINTNVEELYEKLSPADQQFTKILKALAHKPKVLILDEPTQAFNVKDAGLITEMAKRISSEGVSVIYIAHALDEIVKVADRITVLRDGKKIETHDKKTETLNPENLAKEMVGRPVNLFYKKKECAIGNYVFEVRGLKLKQFSK